MKWHGRLGAVILGPTQDRIARYLQGRTRFGRVVIRSAPLARELGVSRSELYRITAQLRTLGLFGIEDDQGGTLGGRRYWRTATRHPDKSLDPVRHRTAWARITAWLKRAGRLARRISTARHPGGRRAVVAPAGRYPAGAAFGELMRAAGFHPPPRREAALFAAHGVPYLKRRPA